MAYGLGKVLEAVIAQVKVLQHDAFVELVWDMPYVVVIKLQAAIKFSSHPKNIKPISELRDLQRIIRI